MATNAAGSTVVYLDTHPAWRADQRREHDLAEAMRRHPAFQSRLEPVTSSDTVVRILGSQ